MLGFRSLLILASLWVASFVHAGAPGHAGTETRDSAEPRRSPIVVGGFELPTYGVALGPVDAAQILAEDQLAANFEKTLRFGVGRPLGATLADGKWHVLPDVGRVWRIELSAEGALGLRVQFVDVDLPRGAEIFVYSPHDPDRTHAYTDRFRRREFWSASTYSDRVIVEYVLPSGHVYDRDHLPFVLEGIQHHYRDPLVASSGSGGSIASFGPACHNDVECYSAWDDVRDACGGVGYIDGDSLFCTGTLLATDAGDFTPYFLTAKHNIPDQAVAETVEVYWRYSSDCGGSSPTLASVSQSAVATLIEAHPFTDASLLMIEGTMTWAVYYAGWEDGPVSPGVAVSCIHHPNGEPKKISFGNAVRGAPSGFLRSDWYDGPTEAGSSGAGLFRDSDQRLVGQLWGGPSTCGDPSTDDFGSFALTYPPIAAHLAFGPDDDFEDNEQCSQAVDLSPGSYPDLVVKNPDDDWYEFTVPPGETYRITASFVHAFGDIDLQLLDNSCGNLIAASESNTDTETLVAPNNFSFPISYQFRVFLTADRRNEYDLSITTSTIPNDGCAAAIVVNEGVIPFSTVGATTDGADEPTECTFSSYSDIANDIWFEYQPTATGIVTASLCGSSYDTKIAVYQGAGCPVAPPIACNDDECGLGSEVTFVARGGETYTLRIGGYQGAIGPGVLNLSWSPPDSCADPIDVTDGTTIFSSEGATTDGPEEPGSCAVAGYANLGRDIWFRYVATCTGVATVSLCGSSFDTKVAAYDTACPTSASAIACNDDSCGLQSEITFDVTIGTVCYLRIGGYQNASGFGSLAISCKPVNDDCTDAQWVGEGTVTGSLIGATNDGAASCGLATATADVWYLYTASCDGTAWINTCGTSDLGGTDQGMDTVLSIHVGCGGDLTAEIDCNDDWINAPLPATCAGSNAGLPRDSAIAVPVDAGDQIVIRVSHFGDSPPGVFQLNIECDALPPANDSCFAASPAIIGGAPEIGHLGGATSDGTAVCGLSSSNPDAWWTFTAPCDGTFYASTCGTHDFGGVDSGMDTVLSAHSACPGSAANMIACNDDAGGCIGLDAGLLRDSFLSVTLSEGETVLVRLSHYGASTPGPFSIDFDFVCDCEGLSDLACSSAGDQVFLSWTNNSVYDAILVQRNLATIATLPGDTTQFTDLVPNFGDYQYTIVSLCTMSVPTVACTVTTSPDTPFVRGNCNGDDFVNIADAVTALEFLFASGDLDCLDACDANDDAAFNIADAVALLEFLFNPGSFIPEPFPNCGGAEAIGCDTFNVCAP